MKGIVMKLRLYTCVLAALLAAVAELAAWQARLPAVRAAVAEARESLDDTAPLDPALAWLAEQTGESVQLSGFNPVKREIARRVIEMLIKDGNVHPRRIEELTRRND